MRPSRVKMTFIVMVKLDEPVDEDCRMTCNDMRDHLCSDLRVLVSRSSVHRVLQGMLYSVKKLRVEKSAIDSTATRSNARLSSNS